MGDFLHQLFSSGRKLVADTKMLPAPKQSKKESPTIEKAAANVETDPHKLFVKRMITEKPKKADVVKEIQKFISAAELDL